MKKDPTYEEVLDTIEEFMKHPRIQWINISSRELYININGRTRLVRPGTVINATKDAIPPELDDMIVPHIPRPRYTAEEV